MQENYELRSGPSTRDIGIAVSALMNRAHWHSFTLLIDPTLLPLRHLLHENQSHLTVRRTVYLPTEDDVLDELLSKISAESGRGSVLVMICDLLNARKVIELAGEYEMLAGRFLWLWLDVKDELRPNEPNLIGSHLLQHARATFSGQTLETFSRSRRRSVTQPEKHELLGNLHTSNFHIEVENLQAYRYL